MEKQKNLLLTRIYEVFAVKIAFCVSEAISWGFYWKNIRMRHKNYLLSPLIVFFPHIWSIFLYQQAIDFSPNLITIFFLPLSILFFCLCAFEHHRAKIIDFTACVPKRSRFIPCDSDVGNIKLNYAERMTLCFLGETEKIAIFSALMTSQFIWEEKKKIVIKLFLLFLVGKGNQFKNLKFHLI